MRHQVSGAEARITMHTILALLKSRLSRTQGQRSRAGLVEAPAKDSDLALRMATSSSRPQQSTPRVSKGMT